jgi:hypothetical protein
MKTIHKYVLSLHDIVDVKMPSDACILSVGNQRGSLVLWAAVEPDNALALRRIAIAGTGHPIDQFNWAATFIGTVIIDPLVWHVFDLHEVTP